ncbi:helix-turn-helix domain-containing protein [Bacillus sp. E214]|uniref:helix-turn-helix domain-containing protein n=1 Tax=Bacillus sp. E214 TaxID=2587156 RepID=UPI0011DF2A46|nr:helix-turn-helix domain-containing protein [Bacillus sp. E214]
MRLNDCPSLLKVKDIQRILGIGQRQTYELVKTEPFMSMRFGDTRFYSKERLIMWLERKDDIVC